MFSFASAIDEARLSGAVRSACSRCFSASSGLPRCSSAAASVSSASIFPGESARTCWARVTASPTISMSEARSMICASLSCASVCFGFSSVALRKHITPDFRSPVAR